jgi:hypothetical protein
MDGTKKSMSSSHYQKGERKQAKEGDMAGLVQGSRHLMELKTLPTDTAVLVHKSCDTYIRTLLNSLFIDPACLCISVSTLI